MPRIAQYVSGRYEGLSLLFMIGLEFESPEITAQDFCASLQDDFEENAYAGKKVI